MRQKICAALIVLVVSFVTVSSWAHHSLSAIYDMSKRITLTGTLTMTPRLVKPSTDALEESPVCIEIDGPRLINSDHHGQR